MKIYYKYKKLTPKLFAGIFCISLVIYFCPFDIKSYWYFMVNVFLSVLLIVVYVYEHKYLNNKYIEITNEEIIIDIITKKKTIIKDILWVSFYADNYIFRTPNKILRITKSRINKENLQEFEVFFNELSTK